MVSGCARRGRPRTGTAASACLENSNCHFAARPSCAWPDKGDMTGPVLTCDSSGSKLADDLAPSVCGGGIAATCPDNSPWVVNSGLAYGFAAAAITNPASGITGLNGDDNCGQCFELVFTGTTFPFGGGAHPSLVGKSMVIQVTNIGGLPPGASFDIALPGSGLGDFTVGCANQFGAGFDFDCGANFAGGCTSVQECERNIPDELVPGCSWRFGWFRWMQATNLPGNPTNNPWVDFRRVSCPPSIVAVSGAVATDDGDWPVIVEEDYDVFDDEFDDDVPTGGGECIPKWGECVTEGDDCCDNGWSCYRQSAYYAQCLESCPSGWSCDDGGGGSCVPMWGDCTQGGDCCNDGWSCYRQSQYYAQCLESCPAGWACDGG